MDFGRSLLLIVTLSSLLLCGNAISLPTPIAQVDIPEIINMSSASQPASVPAELTKLCKDADNPALCVRTILPSLTGPFDPYQALVTEINATARCTRRTIAIITSLIASPNNSKSLSDCLSICKEQYDNILDSLNDTLGTVAKKDMYESKMALSAVISYQQACQDTFNESPGVDFSFSRRSKAIFELAGNCLSIIDAIQQ